MGTEQGERLYRAECIVLRRRDMGEADRLLTCFTRERGKMTLMAKGARKITSRKAGHIELFSHSRFLVARGRTWDIVTQAEAVDVFLPVREDLQRAAYAYYVAELLDRFTEEEDEHQEMFELLRDTMRRLCLATELRLPTRYYELQLLGLAGFRPELFLCVECGQAIQPVTNYFHSARGGMLCPQCASQLGSAREVSLPALKVLRYMQTRPFVAVETLQLRESVHREVEDLLYHYLVYVLEQNVKSVRFLHLLREQIAGSRPVASIPQEAS